MSNVQQAQGPRTADHDSGTHQTTEPTKRRLTLPIVRAYILSVTGTLTPNHVRLHPSTTYEASGVSLLALSTT